MQTELLEALFNWLGHPLRFDQLTPAVFALRRLSEAATVSDSEDDETHRERGIDEAPLPAQTTEWLQFLRSLWAEIEQLPALQRIAYLLNFTAGEGALEIFWLNGIASVRRIGSVIQLTDEHFARAWEDPALVQRVSLHARQQLNYEEKFAVLWQCLPLNDQTIARLLDTERQKVINLRKAAGDRLARRLAAFRQTQK